MTEEQLKEIEARANAATPGPWRVEWDYNGLTVREAKDKDDYWNTFAEDADIAFMSSARTDVPKLCADNRRLEQDNARLRALIKESGLLEKAKKQHAMDANL